MCKGVGPATARRIVDRFGTDTLDILEREPERLTALKGVTAKKAQRSPRASAATWGCGG